MLLQICVSLVGEEVFVSLKPSFSEVMNVAVVTGPSNANLTLIKACISELVFLWRFCRNKDLTPFWGFILPCLK